MLTYFFNQSGVNGDLVREDNLYVLKGEDEGLIFESSEGFLAAVLIGLNASFVDV